jgi:serine/threonine-protein kinase
VAEESLLHAAGRIADGEFVDWLSVTSTMPSEEDRAVAEELALVAQIAAGHRQLHQILPQTGDTPPNLIPDLARWGHLDLLNIVGRGSYGTVYRAWDTRLERLVALKLFHGAPDPEAVMQEGRMLARMRHENVVTVYGADVIDGVAGIWMELIHGRTLENMVRKDGPLPLREAAAIGADIARALSTVHAAGVLHCDVKAQNVVREATGRVVLMDFGAGRIAPEYRDADEVSDVAGTPRYMAPELFTSGSTATKATDIYSFGVLLYFLVSGRFPIEGRTLGELKSAHESGAIVPLKSVRKGLPSAFTELVTRMIDHDPARRPATANLIQQGLEAVAARNAGLRLSWRLLAWLAFAIVLAAVIALGVAMFRSASPLGGGPPANTLAVMPIRNLTGDPSKQYLADGLTEILTAQLARVPGLEVVSSATMAAVRTSGEADRALADRLGVRLLLAGSIVQADDRVRINVTLDDPRAGRALWGTELERTPGTIMSARVEIAKLVAARLSLNAPREPAATVQRSRDAQDAFLRGLVESSSVAVNARMLEAERLFSLAARLEPQWAEPIAYLAYVQQYTTEFGDPARRAERADVVRSNAMRAMELDPTEPMSYVALAAVQAYHDWDLRAAEITLRQALAAAPRDGASRARLSLVLAAAGRITDAVREAEQARSDEPLVPDRHANLGIIRYYARDFVRALEEYDRALAMSPSFGVAHVGRGRTLMALNRDDEAIESFQRAVAISPNPGWVAPLAAVYAKTNRAADLERVLGRLRALEAEGSFVSVDHYAYIAGYRGEFDEAFRWLEQAVARRMTNVLWLAVDPRADVLRGDRRFNEVVERMNVVEQ